MRCPGIDEKPRIEMQEKTVSCSNLGLGNLYNFAGWFKIINSTFHKYFGALRNINFLTPNRKVITYDHLNFKSLLIYR